VSHAGLGPLHTHCCYRHVITCVTRLNCRDSEHEIIPTCRELGIGIVAYSPLGRGFLTGAITKPEDLPEDDWRLKNPRFAGEAFQKVGSRVRRVSVYFGGMCSGSCFVSKDDAAAAAAAAAKRICDFPTQHLVLLFVQHWL
jgi:hypothetical protein